MQFSRKEKENRGEYLMGISRAENLAENAKAEEDEKQIKKAYYLKKATENSKAHVNEDFPIKQSKASSLFFFFFAFALLVLLVPTKILKCNKVSEK